MLSTFSSFTPIDILNNLLVSLIYDDSSIKFGCGGYFISSLSANINQYNYIFFIHIKNVNTKNVIT